MTLEVDKNNNICHLYRSHQWSAVRPDRSVYKTPEFRAALQKNIAETIIWMSSKPEPVMLHASELADVCLQVVNNPEEFIKENKNAIYYQKPIGQDPGPAS